MVDVLETGLLTASSLPAGQRAFYEQKLLENLRTKSILAPFTVMKEDFRARDTGQIVYSEVLDTEPNWNAFSEDIVWLRGASLDSRSVTINLEVHGDVIKISDYNELVNFWNQGDLRGLVDGKLGQNMIDHIDIMARNAFLDHPNKMFGGDATDRATLAQNASDYFLPSMGELARVHLEENEVPGVSAVGDGASKNIVCVTTPRVIHDIRTGAGSDWKEVQEYAGSSRIFSNEVGMYGGVRYIKTNRLRMRNTGLANAQGALDAATVPGQGAAQTVDKVYSVGQAGSTRTVPLGTGEGALFSVGMYVTIHSAPLGVTVLDSDGTQETRRIVAIVGDTLSFDKPLLKPHAAGDYVTNAVDVHGSIFMGGPGVVYGVGERPHPVLLPVIDDLGMIRRLAWRGFVKMQLFRPEMFEVVETAGSTN
jgi:N4-gp56 family major capsid protein